MEQAVVIKIDGDRALVEAAGTEACASCAARHACSSLGGTSKRLSVRNTLSAKPGDIIEFIIDERGVVLSSLIVYLWPILMLIAGMIAGTRYHAGMGVDSDAAAAIGGIIGVAVSLVLIQCINPFIKNRVMFTPRMIRILTRGNCDEN
jgi:sigma-E factor negative regulatory protein RseC